MRYSFKRSTPAQPWLKHKRELKLNKGEIVPVDIEIWPSSTLFKAGERLVLVVKGSEIIPTPPHAMLQYGHEETVNKGTHLVYAEGKYDSFLLVPVIAS